MKASGNRTVAASVPKGAAAAANWKTWGTALPWPSPDIPEGAVVVLSPNHVGFFVGLDGDRVILLGGNQSDRVDRTPFPRSQVVAVRWLNPGPTRLSPAPAPSARSPRRNGPNISTSSARWSPATTTPR